MLFFSFTLPGLVNHSLCVTPAGLPRRHGGRVLRRRGGRALPLPLLLPGSLCLHHHAVCHPPGLETDRLQVSERPAFSRPAFSNCFGKKMPERHRVIYRIVQVSPPRARACFLGRLFFHFFSCQSPKSVVASWSSEKPLRQRSIDSLLCKRGK